MPAISESGHGKVFPTRSIFRTHPTSGAALALLLLVLLVVGCGRTTTQSRASGTRTPATQTATRIAATPTLPPDPLSWVDASLPPGNLLPGAGYGDPLLSVAPGDGNTAYACGAPVSLSTGATIWVTHNRAQHWTRLAPLPIVPEHLSNCWIVPDVLDPAIAVAEIAWLREQAIGEPYFDDGTHFITFDGGQFWQPLRGPQPFNVVWLATYQGTTIASVEANVPGLDAVWISYDQMQTWHSLRVPEQEGGVISINPTTGELLAEGCPPTSCTTSVLATSVDLGLHWTIQAMPPDASTAMVSPLAGNQPWHICVIAQNTSQGNPTPTPQDTSQSSSTLLCSINSGKTWSQRPQLAITYTSPNQGPTTQIATEEAVGSDGTVFADMGAIPNTTIPDTFYQLLPGSDRWQSLGTSPVDLLPPQIAYATAYLPGAGIFWYHTIPNTPDPVEPFQLFTP